MKKFILTALLLGIFTIQAYSQFITTPDTTYYQGFLTNSEGAPINSALPAKVILFNDIGDRYTVFEGDIQIVNGYFSLPILLESNDLGDFKYIGQNLFIEIEIDDKTFNPPIHIVSVPIAKVAQTSDSTLRIRDGAITDIKVHDAAAIKGSKIDPDFEDQIIRSSGGLKLNGMTVTEILDEPDLISNSNTALATQLTANSAASLVILATYLLARRANSANDSENFFVFSFIIIITFYIYLLIVVNTVEN